MKPAPDAARWPTLPAVLNLGAVSFLNTRPLVAGLDGHPTIRMTYAVPSALPGLLQSGRVDLALLPVVDLWRAGERFAIVSDACIASEAETLTVRVFSRLSPERISRLHADPDSHTSVMLARMLWRELYGRALHVAPWSPRTPRDDIDALLLIGDKVVTDAPRGYGFEIDLGGAWQNLTGMPFVFAVWAGDAQRDWTAAAAILAAARDRGVAGAAALADSFGPRHGWPPGLARRYLCDTLRYTLTAAMRGGMQRFREFVAQADRSADAVAVSPGSTDPSVSSRCTRTHFSAVRSGPWSATGSENRAGDSPFHRLDGDV